MAFISFYVDKLNLNQFKFKLMETKKNSKRNSIILVLVVPFCINVFKFVNTQGSEHPILIALFNMIIIFVIIIFL